MTCCVLLIMSPVSNQMAEVGQNAPAPTNNFDMQLGARTKDWEDTTVTTKSSKCDKAGNTMPVEGTAMEAAATNAADKTSLTVENVQAAVVKQLVTKAPVAAAFAGMHQVGRANGAAAFAGMHEFERGNRFGLGEHTAFGAIAEGVTANEASRGSVGTGELIDTSQRRGQITAATILKCMPWISVAMGILSIIILVLAQLGAYVGDMETDVVSLLRWTATMTICGAGTWAWAAKILAIIFVVGLQTAAATQ